MKCMRCGKFMKRPSQEVEIWACKCGIYIAKLDDFRTAQVFAQYVLTAPTEDTVIQ